MGHHRFALAAELGQARGVGYRVEFLSVESAVVVDNDRGLGPDCRSDVPPRRVELSSMTGEEFGGFVGQT